MALPVTLACWNYDRTRALADGRVRPDGIELNYLSLPVEETFFRMLRHREFDACEMSLSSYAVSLMGEEPPFIAIPVFPSRMFRHSGIYISTKTGIREPRDLIGKRVGNPEYQLTAQVWIRGLLADEYGVDHRSVRYFTGGAETPGREEKLKLDLPPDIRIQPIGPTQTLSQMLADGEIDAMYAPRAPSTLRTRPDDVQRLFPDYITAERAYWRKTKLFPIMHTVVIRRELYEANRWMATSLHKAFVEAQRLVYEDLQEIAALKTMLPFQAAWAEETRREMGEDWWPYGFAPNRAALDTFLRYHHEQGLSSRRMRPEELFTPETLEAFRI
ncbi:MAG: ABC transporter substrate-binding protein [Alphaproteobacteria bacterium]|nr:ABC transporter substrate-binding protein [Alphaproteobacteria bacterium]MCW5739023.1 ABC transporter substrate-binding protein [Alphaproteobacteria bacterium]